QVILAERWQERYWQLILDTRSVPHLLSRSEHKLFELDHGELGGRVLAHWHFPPCIVSGVWQHTNPTRGVPFERETACLALAESVTYDHAEGEPGGCSQEEDPGRRIALELLELTTEDLSRYQRQTLENVQFVNALCQIGF
ncbi:MAG TPA: HDOD domain-containing protein, partial [Verrucomicrobiae bacterium]|nr:HDOD domain-containing protein [Verrucomicrobiae bacterium]